MTWGQYAADHSRRHHETLAAVVAAKQQADQADAAALAAINLAPSPTTTNCTWNTFMHTLDCTTF